MGLIVNIIIILIIAWLLYGLYDMWRNKERTTALMSMALNTGRKEGVEIRKKIDEKIKKK